MKSVIPVLAAAEIETSMAFYLEVLGFETSFVMRDNDGRVTHASVHRGASEIMIGTQMDVPISQLGCLGAGVNLYMTVGDDEDIDAMFAHAKAKGASVLQEPKDQYWGHRDWGILDPDGYKLYVSKEVRTWAEVAPELESRELVPAGD